MADGIFHFHFFRRAAVAEEDLHGVGDGAFVRFEIFAGVARVFAHEHLRAEGVNARVGGGRVLVMVGGERAEDQADGGHVLQAMVAVGRVVQRPGLVNDAEGGFVRVNLHALDLVEAFQWSADGPRPQRPRILRRLLFYFVRPFPRRGCCGPGRPALREILLMQLDRGFDGGLRVELGGEGNLEQNIFHHIRAERAREFDGLAAKEHVAEAPLGRGERGGITHLAFDGHEGVLDGAGGGVAGGPGFARAGVGRVAIGAQRAAVEPGVGDGVDDLLARAAEQLRGDGGGGDADEQDVIEADAVEAVFQREDALDFVGFDHREA